VLMCLILSVVSTVEQFEEISVDILFYVVSYCSLGLTFISEVSKICSSATS